MDLTSTFQNSEGAVTVKSFQKVPITQDTAIKLYAYDDADTEYLIVYRQYGAEPTEIWEDADKIVNAPNKELTDWLLNRVNNSSSDADPGSSLRVVEWLENSVILEGPPEALEALRQVWAAACDAGGRPVLTAAAASLYPIGGGPEAVEAVFPARPERGWRLFFLDAAGRPLGRSAELK